PVPLRWVRGRGPAQRRRALQQRAVLRIPKRAGELHLGDPRRVRAPLLHAAQQRLRGAAAPLRRGRARGGGADRAGAAQARPLPAPLPRAQPRRLPRRPAAPAGRDAGRPRGPARGPGAVPAAPPARPARVSVRPAALVVFDLDGTLVDSSADLAAALNETLARLPPRTRAPGRAAAR